MSISRHQAVGAYRRWQPADFDADGTAPSSPDADPAAHTGEGPGPAAIAPASAPAAPEPPPPAPELPPDFRLPTAEEIERMHEEVRRAGFEEGRREGLAEGLESGRREGYQEGRAQAVRETERLAQLVASLDAAIQALDAEIAEEIMALAIEMARRMVRLTLAEHPETILDTVHRALLELPQGHAQIHLNPDDLGLVREHIGDQLTHGGHRLSEDARLQRGECRIEGQGILVDATLQTRWRRVLESIGHHDAAWNPEDAPADADEQAGDTRDGSSAAGEGGRRRGEAPPA